MKYIFFTLTALCLTSAIFSCENQCSYISLKMVLEDSIPIIGHKKALMLLNGDSTQFSECEKNAIIGLTNAYALEDLAIQMNIHEPLMRILKEKKLNPLPDSKKNQSGLRSRVKTKYDLGTLELKYHNFMLAHGLYEPILVGYIALIPIYSFKEMTESLVNCTQLIHFDEIEKSKS